MTADFQQTPPVRTVCLEAEQRKQAPTGKQNKKADKAFITKKWSIRHQKNEKLYSYISRNVILPGARQ
jgi:hypothetical protein